MQVSEIAHFAKGRARCRRIFLMTLDLVLGFSKIDDALTHVVTVRLSKRGVCEINLNTVECSILTQARIDKLRKLGTRLRIASKTVSFRS